MPKDLVDVIKGSVNGFKAAGRGLKKVGGGLKAAFTKEKPVEIQNDEVGEVPALTAPSHGVLQMDPAEETITAADSSGPGASILPSRDLYNLLMMRALSGNAKSVDMGSPVDAVPFAPVPGKAYSELSPMDDFFIRLMWDQESDRANPRMNPNPDMFPPAPIKPSTPPKRSNMSPFMEEMYRGTGRLPGGFNKP